ncbi:MAG: PIN domain-containing protein [Pseudomonadota bacterium]
MEAVAFSMVLQLVETEKVELVTSSIIAFENSKNPFPQRRKWVDSYLNLSKHTLILNAAIRKRSRELEKQGIKPLDALHLSCAEAGKIDYFLTCDDRVVKRYEGRKMVVCNPVEFILKITEEENQ